MLKLSTLITVITFFFIFFYLSFFHISYFVIKTKINSVILISLGTIVTGLLLSPLMNTIVSKKLAKKIDDWEAGKLTSIEERTLLFEEIMSFPIRKGIEAIILFGSISIGICIMQLFFSIEKLDLCGILGMIASSVFIAFNAALFAIYFMENICYQYGVRIVDQGIDKEYVNQRQTFGLPIGVRTFMYLILPLLLSNLVFILYLYQNYSLKVLAPFSTYSRDITNPLFRLIFLFLTNIVFCIFHAVSYYKQITRSSINLCNTITSFLGNKADNAKTGTNLSDQMQYNIYVLNNILEKFNSLMTESVATGKEIRQSTLNLLPTATELYSTSIEQRKEIVRVNGTMDELRALSNEISGLIANVKMGTENTNLEVTKGFKIFEQNINQIEEVKKANQEIIGGIDSLGTKIEGIGNIISIINEIADQTRVIAFNAELEAVASGDQGKNLHIVSTEIRRLANTTMNRINEIMDYYKTVKNSQENLIKTCETVAEYINEANSISQNLFPNLKNIKDSSEQTSNKSTEIAIINEQQKSSFTQISETLKQIQTGFERFAESTESISFTTNKMEHIAQSLENM